MNLAAYAIMTILSLLLLERSPPGPDDVAPDTGVVPDAPPPIDYLIIAPEAFRDELEPLLTFHRGLGRTPSVLTLDAITAMSPAATGSPASAGVTSDQIRNAVEAVARDNPLRFLLLVGDPAPRRDGAPALPAGVGRKVPYPGIVDDDTFPTDWTYSVESRAGRVAVGRFPVSTEAEVTAMVDKTLRYAQDAGGPWQRRLALFGGPANFNPFVDALIESETTRLLDEAIPYEFDVDFVFAKPSSAYAWRPDDLGGKIGRELSEGALFAAYFGHGMPTALDLVEFRDRYYSIGDAEQLANISIPNGKPIFFALACHTGAFDQKGGALSLAEGLFLNPNGPIAVVASSRTSHPYGNAVLGRAMVAELLIGRPATVGEAVLAVKRAMGRHRMFVGEVLVPGDVRTLFEEHAALYNLLGDPGLPIRYPGGLRVETEGPTRVGLPIRIRVEHAGKTTITLETRRKEIRGALEPVPATGAVEDAFAAMARNHDVAIDKVVHRVDADLRSGEVVSMPPAPGAGSYVVKVFAHGPHSAAGSVLVEVGP
ncbi:MAG: hypothetical protein IV100_12740 [Myxococcales bacterium]|nr:hypothetical protein [Myxococcales bacterium]